jgi:hypothetical protein
MIPWTSVVCVYKLARKLTLAQPLMPTNLDFYFTFSVVAQHWEICQQDERLELKNFNVLKFLQVFYKIGVSIK